MSLEKVVSRIEADSKAAEQAILKEARAEKAEALAEAGRKRDDILADFARRAATAVEQLRSRETAGLEMELKKRALASRRRILDAAFAAVLEHFAALPQSDKKSLYAAMMRRASAEIGSGTVRCLKGEEHLFAGHPGFRTGAPIDGPGGFIVISANGLVEVDMRFEVLLRDVWERNLGRISGLLFGEAP